MENSLTAPVLFAIDASVGCIQPLVHQVSDLPSDLPRILKRSGPFPTCGLGRQADWQPMTQPATNRWGQGVCHRLTGVDTAQAGSVVVMAEFKETEVNGSTAA